MSNKTILILSIDFLIFIILMRLFFHNLKEIKRCLCYLIKPDIFSIMDKDYDNDFNYTHKFLFVVVIMVLISFVEFYLFYFR